METFSLIIHLQSGTAVQTEMQFSADLEDEEVLERVRNTINDRSCVWKLLGGLLVHAGAIGAVELA